MRKRRTCKLCGSTNVTSRIIEEYKNGDNKKDHQSIHVKCNSCGAEYDDVVKYREG